MARVRAFRADRRWTYTGQLVMVVPAGTEPKDEWITTYWKLVTGTPEFDQAKRPAPVDRLVIQHDADPRRFTIVPKNENIVVEYL